MQYQHGPKFDKSLTKLSDLGPNYMGALRKVMKVLERAHQSKPLNEVFLALPVTNHGERRIKNAWKYDLPKRCRLVVQVHSNLCEFLFVGRHSDTDSWLDKNRGYTRAYDRKTRKTIVYSKSESEEQIPKTERDLSSIIKERKLIDILDKNDLDLLLKGKSASFMNKLNKLTTSSADSHIDKFIEVSINDDEFGLWVDILYDARNIRNKQKIKNRIKSHNNEIIDSCDWTDEDIKDISEKGSDNLVILNNSSLDYQLYENFIKTASFHDWMLYMHPDQKKLAYDHYDSPVRLRGVSGSGKTAVIINRAAYLAKKYKNDKVLILTLNKPLAEKIEAVTEKFNLENLLVMDIRECFGPLAKKFQPKVKFKGKSFAIRYEDRDEHQTSIHESWQEFYNNELNNDAAWTTMSDVHQSLLSHKNGIYPEEYIKEEFDYLRSETASKKRENYYDIQRIGRSVQFQKDFRKQIIEGLNEWEYKMALSDSIDLAGLSSILYSHIAKIKPIYRSILIDEEQDFGTIDLAIIRKLVKERENDLFLAGDIAQKVYVKKQSHTLAGISFTKKHKKEILKNYRNSKEILEAAYNIYKHNLDENSEYSSPSDKSLMIQSPEYADYSYNKPLICSAKSLNEELTYGFHYIQDALNENSGQIGCLAVSGVQLNQLEKLFDVLISAGFKNDIQLLDGEAVFKKNKGANIFLSDLDSTKGFEFDVMVIVGCSAKTLPNPYLPQEEHYRDLGRFYVAMTRAKTNLVISYSEKKSKFLALTEESNNKYFSEHEWTDYFDSSPNIEINAPITSGYIERIQMIKDNSDSDFLSYSELDGRSLLLTRRAVGMSKPRQNRLLKFISGTRTNSKVVRDKRWPNLKSLFEEDDYVINNILGGSAEEPKAEVNYYADTFGIDYKASKIPKKSKVAKDLTQLKSLLKKQKDEMIKSETVKERHTPWSYRMLSGKCTQCSRPAMQGDSVCYSCNPG